MDLGNVLIMGDSYSTFEGYIPEGYRIYYYADKECENTDVRKVHQTWWHQLFSTVKGNLVLNNSWSGSTIGYIGYNGENTSTTSSFLYRLKQLQQQGFFESNRIDTVFIFGGTNDNWCGAPLGENKTGNWEEKDLYFVRPAVHCFMSRIRQALPEAKMYSILNTELKGEIVAALREASTANHIQVIALQDIDKCCGHPTILGMEQIYQQVLAAL